MAWGHGGRANEVASREIPDMADDLSSCDRPSSDSEESYEEAEQSEGDGEDAAVRCTTEQESKELLLFTLQVWIRK